MIYKFEQSLGKLSQQVNQSIISLLGKNFKEHGYDLNSKDWMILSHVKYFKKISQIDLGTECGLNKVMINRITEKLAALGYIHKEIDLFDKRVRQISLTEEGLSIYKNLKKITEKTLSELVGGISEEEIATCINTLIKVRKNFEKQDS